jgi:predicted transcriptional regulator of viral defense system
VFRLPGWPARDEDRYVLWRLWSHDLAAVSHQSALVVHDLGDVSPTRLHLTVPPGFRAKDAAVVIHRAVLAPGDVEDRDGYQITSVQRTLFDVAASADMTQEQMDVAVADAVKRKVAAPRGLRHRADEFGPRAALRIERALAALESEA